MGVEEGGKDNWKKNKKGIELKTILCASLHNIFVLITFQTSSLRFYINLIFKQCN